MTKSSRTSVRLTDNLWDFIDDSIGILGYNRSDVIGVIVLSFFKNEKNVNEIELMKKRRSEILEKLLREKRRTPEILQEKIGKLLEISDNIPLETFLEHLDINPRIFHENLYEWAKKLNFKFENNKIIK